MQIDAFTVLLFGIFIKALLGVLFLIFWLKDTRSTWFAWWSATFLFGVLATLLFLVRGFAGELFAIGAGAAFVIAAFACCWQGARAFDRRRPLWLAVRAGAAVFGCWPARCRAFSRTSPTAWCCRR